MGCIFDHCSLLEILDLSNFNTSNALNMTATFRDCSNLSVIYVSRTGWITSQANCNEMFNRCKINSVTYID